MTKNRQEAERLEAKKLEHFRKILEKEKRRIEADLQILEKENMVAVEAGEATGDDNFEDQIGDSASITFERERDFSLEKNMRDILSQIDIALQKLDSSNYGICSNCHQKIDEARLRALPYTELCIECKKKQEQG